MQLVPLHHGTPESGEMELAAPEFLYSEPLRALFDRFATSVDYDDGYDDDTGAPRLMGSLGFIKMLENCGLIDDADDESHWRGGMMSAAAANLIFARARGGAAECDAALAFAPDFIAALAWVAAARGTSFGEVAGKVLALGPPPPTATLAAATDSGASKGYNDEPDEAFKYEVFNEHDELESTGLSTPANPTRLSAAARAGAPPRAEASEALREAFRCMDLAHRGAVPGSALIPLLGAAGAFNHLDLNAAAVFLQARLARLFVEYDDELTLPECGKHLRAFLRLPPPASVAAGGSAIRGPTPILSEVKPEDVVACRRIFERFCGAGREAGFGTEPHPTLMDAPRWEVFARKASLFDVDLHLGAERIAFARACPSGNLRLGFREFMTAVGYVAAQKGIGGNAAAAVVKRTKLSIGPAQVATPRAPGRGSSGGGSAFGFDGGGGGSGGGRFSVGGGMGGGGILLPGGRFARKKAGPAAVAHPEAAEAVIAAAAPVTAFKLPLVLADIGALEGLKPVAAGAAIAGARVAFDAEHDSARVARDDIVRVTEILEALRKDDRRVDPRPPPRSLKIYEDHINLRKVFFAFCVFGQSPASANANGKRLHATWQQSLVDSDYAACRERFEAYGGPKRIKPNQDLLEGTSEKPTLDVQLFAPLEVTNLGPGSRTVGFNKAFATRPDTLALRTSRLFGHASPPRVHLSRPGTSSMESRWGSARWNQVDP
jgi:hypothetical protein